MAEWRDDIETTKVPALIRVPWRVRLRAWWQRWRETEWQRECREYVERRTDEAVLFGWSNRYDGVPMFPEEQPDEHDGVPPDEEVHTVEIVNERGFVDIEVDERTVRLGVVLGLMEWDEQQRVHVLTDRGREWLITYCEEKIEEAQS